MGKKRRTPRRHTVHPKDPRYTVSQYPRGSGTGPPIRTAKISSRDLLEERYINAYRNAWNSTEGLSYAKVGRMTNRELERGIRSLNDMAELTKKRTRRPPDYSKSTIIYANSEDEARSKVKERFGAVREVEYMGKNDMGNPYYRVTFIPRKKKKS